VKGPAAKLQPWNRLGAKGRANRSGLWSIQEPEVAKVSTQVKINGYMRLSALELLKLMVQWSTEKRELHLMTGY
jgi:hypothetical protein